MQINQLPSVVTKKKKRLGRGYGSGVGAKSGRGTTRHQAARENIKIFYEGGQNPITKKFPLLRGKGRNRALFRSVIIKLHELNVFDNGATIDIAVLKTKKIITEKESRQTIKLLNGKKLEKSLTIALPASKNAIKAIIDAGGKIITT